MTSPRNATGAATLLETVGVVKRYPGTPPVEVLCGVDLAVREGDLMAIVGPSGSGKSTLLHLLGTLERPTEGRVLLVGRDVSALPDRQLARLRAARIGFVFQQFFLLDGMNAVDNVATGLLYRGVPNHERRRAAKGALERVGLGHRLDHRPSQLSGGERQRVAIARAVVGRPAVVLADEPTGNLDTRSGQEVFSLLRELNEEGASIVVITHERALAEKLPRRVEIVDGRVVHDTAVT
jgi:putative ABC transport system ATP-binding protein